MRYFNEQKGYPQPEYLIKSTYGIDPEADPVTALAIGIYPLTEAPEGYTATHYVKEGDRYVAVPSPVSNAELAVVEAARADPEQPAFWSDVIEGSGPSNNFRWATSDLQFVNLEVGDVIYGCEPIGAIPIGATCLSKTESSGVTTWSESIVLSGQDVPFRVTTGKPEP